MTARGHLGRPKFGFLTPVRGRVGPLTGSALFFLSLRHVADPPRLLDKHASVDKFVFWELNLAADSG